MTPSAPPGHMGAFSADVAMVAVAAWLLVLACGERGRGTLEAAMAWCLAFAALVGGASVVLGEAGGLGVNGFLGIHAAALLALVATRWRCLSADYSAAKRAGSTALALLGAGSAESVAASCLLLVLALLAAVAALAHPAAADALTYHLPRIGQWLEDGRVHELASQDARMNFVAAVPDLFMSWLVCGTASGFRPAVLAQALGGVMALGATVGLARHTGLGRVSALLTGALLLGMANVAVQFTSAQTDLFTAGIFAAAFYLWVCALGRGTGSVLGGTGAGFALGAKGTLFYLAPGALVWVAAAAWGSALPWAQWRRTLIAAILGLLLFAAPGFVRNWRMYGDPLGPKEWVSKLHQGALSPADYARKLRWNLTSSLAQVFEPQSQPHGLRSVGRAAVGWLAQLVPERDPYTLDGLGRRDAFQNAFLGRTEPDADVTSFGIVAFALFLAGSAASLARWRQGGRRVAAWSAGVVVFLVFFHAMQQWHPYAFRYFILAAPWVAVVSAWGIERLSGGSRILVWTVALAAAADVGWNVTLHTHQSGWRSVVQPTRSLTYYAADGWGAWSDALPPSEAPLLLCLPEERPVAGFYRRPTQRPVSFMRDPGNAAPTAEDFTRGKPGWVVVPARRFLGREGRVAASVWLCRGDDGSPFSIAAYRPLQTGERPRPVIYRDLRSKDRDGVTHEVLVKTWGTDPARLLLSNPGSEAVGYRLLTPLGRISGEVPSIGTAIVEVLLPTDSVSEVDVHLDSPKAGGFTEASVGLAP